MAFKRDYIKEAAQAYSDLCIFASLAAILEGGCITSAKSHKTAQRIIDICCKEQQKRLRDYDAAKAKITSP